jgi:hypothetical protein
MVNVNRRSFIKGLLALPLLALLPKGKPVKSVWGGSITPGGWTEQYSTWKGDWKNYSPSITITPHNKKDRAMADALEKIINANRERMQQNWADGLNRALYG